MTNPGFLSTRVFVYEQVLARECQDGAYVCPSLHPLIPKVHM